MADLRKTVFLKSIVRLSEAPTPRRPSVCLLGRSNVGKSSLINALTGRRDLAYVSNKPGRTTTLNYYDVDKTFHLIDAPGYGYAGGRTRHAEAFASMMEPYFDDPCLRLVILLLDARRGPGEDDVLLYRLLQELAIRTLIVCSKEDKLNQSERCSLKKKLAEYLPDEEVIILNKDDEKTLALLRKRLLKEMA